MVVNRKFAAATNVLLQLLLALLIGGVVILAAVYLLQRSLIYLPDRKQPSATVLENAGLRFWPTSDAYRGFIANTVPAKPKGVIVVFHGNAGAGWQRDYYVHALQPLGYLVLLAEYPGYGGRAGAPGEEVFVADARQTVQHAYQQFGGPLIIWGESLGCGVAAALAADSPVPLSAVVMLTPWYNLEQMARSVFGYLPARWLLIDKYENAANLSEFSGPVAVLLAEQDEVIPLAQGKRLYDSLQGPKKLWVFDAAGHNSWPATPSAPWWREVMAYIEKSY